MAAADTTTADSITGLGETLQNLISINTAGFAGIETSLRNEFKSQNSLLGGYLGKNLQLIADAITNSSDALLSQMSAEARAAAEAAREALAGAKGGGDADGVEVTDKSLEFGVVGILAAVSGFIIGFFQGFFGPIKKMIMKPLTFAWKSFKAIIKDSAIGRWYRLVKGWFTLAQVDAKTGKFTPSKWKNFKTFLKNNAIVDFYKSVKGWFAKGDMGKEWKNIKSFFSGKGGIKMPGWLTKIFTAVKAAKNGVFSFFKSIGRIFGKLFFWVQIIMAAFDFVTGFIETKGNLWEKIWGGVSKAIKNFFGGFLDLGIMLEDAIKWIIKKIAGFFGFDEAEVGAMMEGFSIFGPIKDGLFAVVDWIVKLMTDPLAAFSEIWSGVKSIGTWIYDKAIKPIWDWFEGMFPNAAASLKAAWGKIASVGKWIYDEGIKPVWDWVKGIFTWTPTWTGEEFNDFNAMVSGAFSKAWKWIKGIFSFGSEKKEEGKGKETGGIGGFLKGIVDDVWAYFNKLFKFGSISDVMKSYFNLLTFFPNIIKDAIAGVTSWLLGLFGFNEAAKTVANAKNFSLGDMLFTAISKIWDWFKDLLGIDVMAIAKSIPGAETLLKWLTGGEAAEKGRKTLAGLGKGVVTDMGGTMDDMEIDLAKLKQSMVGMSKSQIGKLASTLTTMNANVGAGADIENFDNIMKAVKTAASLAPVESGGGTTTIIQDNSQNVSNQSQPLVLPTPEISPESRGPKLARFGG